MSVLDLSVDDLADRLSAWGEPRYRAKQIYAQLWRRSADFEEMTDIAPARRERLADELPIRVDVLQEQVADAGFDVDGRGPGAGSRGWPTGWRRSAAHSRSSRRREQARG